MANQQWDHAGARDWNVRLESCELCTDGKFHVIDVFNRRLTATATPIFVRDLPLCVQLCVCQLVHEGVCAHILARICPTTMHAGNTNDTHSIGAHQRWQRVWNPEFWVGIKCKAQAAFHPRVWASKLSRLSCPSLMNKVAIPSGKPAMTISVLVLLPCRITARQQRNWLA